MRLLLTWLIAGLLLLQSGASAAMFRQPCPMGGAAHSTQPASADTSHGDDCCNDAATAAASGQPCKTDLGCGAGAMGLPAPAAAMRMSAHAASCWPRVSARVAMGDPPGVWRPPSSFSLH